MGSVIGILRKHYPGDWKYAGWGTWSGPFEVYARPKLGVTLKTVRAVMESPGQLGLSGVRTQFEYIRADTQQPVPELA